MTDITQFTGYYRFLSNFYPCNVELESHSYPSVEHAYQAAKCSHKEEMVQFQDRTMKAAEAKLVGKHVKLKRDWGLFRIPYMEGLVTKKFNSSARLQEMLLAIDGKIVEGNYWGETFWGECPLGTGYNHLGKILMRVRDKLK